MVARTTTPDPARFPDPQTVATWIKSRSPQFKTHTGLGQAKNAISGSARVRGTRHDDRIIADDCYVYEWNPEVCVWVELHHLPAGRSLAEHPFYRTVARRGAVVAPSDKAMAKALASIQEAL